MSYLRAGVYAEGPTDYAFLLSLLDRLLPELAHAVVPEVSIIDDSIGVDAAAVPRVRRAERIAAAIDSFWDQCTLFVVHADGDGDSDRALREQIEPGITSALARHPDLAAAPCVPVREIEAWLLVDRGPLAKLIRVEALPDLPMDSEALLDPKAELKRVLAAGRGTKLQRDIYAFVGANIDLDALRRLPAFQRFEAQLVEAIRVAARAR